MTYQKHRFVVPERDSGWSVWVANDFDQYVEIMTGETLIGRYDL